MIVKFLFGRLGIMKPTYVDVGAYHPTAISNTYLFYRSGCRGVCVEADPEQTELFRLKRPRDLCLNAAVVPGAVAQKSECVRLYVMSVRSLNTISEAQAAQMVSAGVARIDKVVTVPAITINAALETAFGERVDFLSLDVEGIDLEVLRSLDTERLGPPVVCIETAQYGKTSHDGPGEIGQVMASKGYRVYAHTGLNTIFVSQAAWDARRT